MTTPNPNEKGQDQGTRWEEGLYTQKDQAILKLTKINYPITLGHFKIGTTLKLNRGNIICFLESEHSFLFVKSGYVALLCWLTQDNVSEDFFGMDRL